MLSPKFPNAIPTSSPKPNLISSPTIRSLTRIIKNFLALPEQSALTPLTTCTSPHPNESFPLSSVIDSGIPRRLPFAIVHIVMNPLAALRERTTIPILNASKSQQNMIVFPTSSTKIYEEWMFALE